MSEQSLKGDYFFGCSDCPWRTENVKIDGKDEFHDLKPYCDLKMRFIGKNERAIKFNETCQEAIETANDDLGGVSIIGEDEQGNPITSLSEKSKGENGSTSSQARGTTQAKTGAENITSQQSEIKAHIYPKQSCRVGGSNPPSRT